MSYESDDLAAEINYPALSCAKEGQMLLNMCDMY